MVNLGTVNEDATIYFYYSTAAADGGEEDWSATLEQADIIVHKDGSAMTLDASTITPSNVATGLQKVAIDLSNDADFTGGSTYWVMVDASDETIDSQAVSGVLGVFSIESASEKAVRLLRENFYPSDSEISTVTSNSTTAINLTDVVDAQTPDAALVGTILGVHDVTDGRVERVVVTSVSSKVATVQRLGDGTAMSFTVAAGDHVWEIGYSDLAHVPDANVTKAAGQTVSATATVDLDDIAAILLDTDTTIPGLIAALNDLSAAEVNAEVDTALTDYDAATGTELAAVETKIDTVDTVVDAIKVVTDALGSAAATKLSQTMAGAIAGAAATGTLSTTQASTDLTGFADDQLIGRTIVVTAGAAQGEATEITDYANTNGLLDFNALTTAMADGDTFVIV